MKIELLPTADVVDAHPGDFQSLALQLRSFGTVRLFGGLAHTIRCHEDNALVRQELSTPGEGRVLFIDGGGSVCAALVGDQIAGLAVMNEWAGIIVHGAIRDSAVINTMAIGVKALGTNPMKSSKTGSGEIGATLTIAGGSVRPGALVIADDDGVLVHR